MKRLALLAIPLLVTNCAPISFKEYITISKPRLICQEIAEWKPDKQDALLRVFNKAAPRITPEQQATAAAITELSALREGARECHKQQKLLEQGNMQ